MNRGKLLDYLYGEMTPGESVEFEKMLAENSELQREVEELQRVREYLGQSKDHAMSPMQLVVKAPESKKVLNHWWKIAASLLLLLMAGKLLDIQVTIDQHQFTIGYGKVESVDDDPSVELQQQYAKLEKSLVNIQSQLSSYQEIVRQSAQTLPSGQTMDMGYLAKMVGNMVDKEQVTNENQLVAKILEDQQISMQSMAQGLIRYWDEQRKHDLQMINSGLENLVQAIQLNSRDLTQFVNSTQQNY